MLRATSHLSCVTALLFFAPVLQAVVISEIHYHPRAGNEALEFIEITNEATSAEDISGWAFTAGIRFSFPQGTVLRAGESLVVCADVAAVVATYGIENALGNYEGRLSAAGERVTLVNHVRVPKQSVRYRDQGKWPAAPDGTGHSLVLRELRVVNAEPESWTQSPELGGSPGRENFPEAGSVFEESVLLALGEEWRFRRGTGPFSEPATAWRESVFDDSDWELGPSGFGYGDDDDQTVLDDMRDGYTSVAIRRVLEVGDVELDERSALVLSVQYDDGFCAYVNGVPVAGANCPEEGTWDAVATAVHEAVPGEEEIVEIPREILRPGANVLAIVGYNLRLSNNDFSLAPRVLLRRFPEANTDAQVDVVFNELRRGAEVGVGWVELYNRDTVRRHLSGWSVTDDPDRTDAWVLPEGTQLAPGSFLVLEEAVTGLSLSAARVALFLVSPSGQVAAATVFDRGTELDLAAGGFAEARFPDGGVPGWVTPTPTPGEPNQVPRLTDVVINELFYHPPDDRRGEFLELYHRGSEAVDLSGFRFNSGISYTLPAGTVLEPGGYLVVSEAPGILAEHYAYPNALGPYAGSLANGGENIRLVDRLGNLVDEVRYFDGGDWSPWADGAGSSLELIDPSQDNDFATAWDASDEAEKSSWEEHTFTFREDESNAGSELHLLLVGRGVCRLDDISVAPEVFDETVLVAAGDAWRFKKGTEPFSEPPAAWREPDFDDTSWSLGPAGFGFGDDDDTTILDDMAGNYTSLAIRRRFEIAPALFDSPDGFALALSYDDGFCAFLNGVEVARKNCPEELVPEATATQSHEVRREEFFAVPRELLRAGENVLTVVGYNRRLNDTDFTLLPRLVQRHPAGLGDNQIPNPGFEEDTSPWRIDGTHVHSRRSVEDAFSGGASLELVATGKGDSLCNRIETDIEPELEPDRTYQVSLWTRWLRGASGLLAHGVFSEGRFPTLRVNLSDNSVAGRMRLTVPRDLGTPGEENSVRLKLREQAGTDNLGPVFCDLRQLPVAPEPGMPVTITVRVNDGDGVQSVRVFFREDRSDEGEFGSVELVDQGDGRYRGEVPALSDGITQVLFYIEATDAVGNARRFPLAAPEKPFFYRTEGVVEEPVRVYLSQASRDVLESRPGHSNDLVDGTFVFAGEEIFHNVGVRYRGSPWGRPTRQSIRVRFHEDRRWGTRRKVNLSKRDPADGAIYALATRLGTVEKPVPVPDYKWTNIRFDDVIWPRAGVFEVYDRQFVEQWYGPEVARDGVLLKGNGRFRFDSSCRLNGFDDATLHHRGENTENYRFYWRHVVNQWRDNWQPFIDATRVLDPASTGDAEFNAEFERWIDVEQFCRVLVPRTFVNDQDGLFLNNGHNGYILWHPQTGRWQYFPFDMAGLRSPPDSLFSFKDPVARRFLEQPRSARTYYRVADEYLDGYWSVDVVSPFFDAIAEVAGLGEVKRYIGQTRASYVEQLEPFVSPSLSILTNGGQDLFTDAASVLLEGAASVRLLELLWRHGDGGLRPFEPTWISAVEWQVLVPLSEGANRLEFFGLDRHGEITESTAITISRAAGSEFLRGDVDGNLRVNLADPLRTLRFLFGGTPLLCPDAADFDDTGRLEVTDVIGTLEYLFRRGAPPSAPFPTAGMDPSEDALGCGIVGGQ